MSATTIVEHERSESPEEEARRELAIKRLRAKNAFKIHLVVYTAVNLMLIVIWAVTVAGGWTSNMHMEPLSQNFFWPIFPIVGWGVGLAINGYVAYGGSAITEDQIRHEMDRLR